MELKGYQQTNLNELDRFCQCVAKRHSIKDGFTEFWETNNPPITPFPDTIIAPYRDNVKGAPHICHKVPTGGGKTFIASAAIKVAMNHINAPYKVVVWLVPSNAILEQTLRNLRNKQHPYRQRIDTDFANRVEIFDKQQALMGQGFSLTTVRENLCILVMSFDSFRTNNKDGRKVYQENGYLQSFAPLVSLENETDDEVQLMKVLQAVHPLVIVDESHNATSKLSEQMLNDLQPSFVIDLTATPRENSNIICFTDALELKRCNMVKLPVIVYNHSSKSQVIDSALHLQRRLEQTAKQQPSGNYIRPIVLFQAESKLSGVEDRDTFEKVKETLLKLRIPEEQIKIKTADIDELKGVDLMSPDCPVRYIITVNALKEGWDCPFAYILASLADKSSSVDVEQIVGRVLRLPYASRNQADILNLSYVLTASAKFQETLENVVKGLNNAGFSDKDYRAVDAAEPEKPAQPQVVNPTSLFPEAEPQVATSSDDIDFSQITFTAEAPVSMPMPTKLPQTVTSAENKDVVPEPVNEILTNAIQQAEDMNQQLKSTDEVHVAPELAPAVKTATIQSIFAESAKEVKLPIFFVPNTAPDDSLFGDEAEEMKLEGQHLLANFKLSAQSADITFDAAETSMYKVDIDEHDDGHAPRYEKVKGKTYEFILDYIRQAENFEAKMKRCARIVAETMGKMIPLTEKDIQAYVARIFEGFDNERLEDFMRHLNEYTLRIRDKILELEKNFKKDEFRRLIDTDGVFLKEAYSIPNKISLKTPMQGIPKMLHTKEESVNGFEAEVINDVANLDNVEWWTRNVEKKDFFINGFINHYPDFIIKTKKGKVILLESKGDHLDAEDKILLGSQWAHAASANYRYYLVYDKRKVEGAFTKDEFIKNLSCL